MEQWTLKKQNLKTPFKQDFVFSVKLQLDFGGGSSSSCCSFCSCSCGLVHIVVTGVKQRQLLV